MLPSISISSRLLGRLSFFIFYFIFFRLSFFNTWEKYMGGISLILEAFFKCLLVLGSLVSI